MRRGFGDLPVYTDPSGFSTVDPFGIFTSDPSIGSGAQAIANASIAPAVANTSTITTATGQALNQVAQNLGNLPTSSTLSTSNWTILAIACVTVVVAIFMTNRK